MPGSQGASTKPKNWLKRVNRTSWVDLAIIHDLFFLFLAVFTDQKTLAHRRRTSIMDLFRQIDVCAHGRIVFVRMVESNQQQKTRDKKSELKNSNLGQTYKKNTSKITELA